MDQYQLAYEYCENSWNEAATIIGTMHKTCLEKAVYS